MARVVIDGANGQYNHAEYGGFLYCSSANSIAFSNSYFLQNNANYGSFYISTAGTVTLDKSEFFGNSTTDEDT